MALTEDSRKGLEDQMVELAKASIKEKRIIIPSKLIGSAFRSRDEIQDVVDVVRPYKGSTLFQGLCGGRARWKTFEKPPIGLVHYIERHHGRNITERVAGEILEQLPLFSPDIHTDKKIDLSSYGLPYIIPYSALIHDIDILLVSKEFKISQRFLQKNGQRTGVGIDLFFITPAAAAHNSTSEKAMEMFDESIGLSI